MKLLIVLTAAAALVGASQNASGNIGKNSQGNVVSNEILRTNRRIFSGSGGWGSSGGGGGGGDSYRQGPPPLDTSGFMSLFNAMSGLGLSSNYGAPASGGSGGNGGGRKQPQYGPPKPAYGPPRRPGAGGSGGGRPSSQYGAPGSGGNGQGGSAGGYSSAGNGGAGGLPLVSTKSRGVGNGAGAAAGGRGANGLGGGAGADGGRIFRYVSLFTAPEEPAPTRPKVVRAGPTTPDKHVNIIFVKPPTHPAEAPVEVQLSPEPERKTIVYVLMKRPIEGQDNVRVITAQPTSPPKPEVYFIPYKDPSGQQGGGQGGEEGGSGGGNQDGGAGGGGYNDGSIGDLNAPGQEQGPIGGYGPAAGGPGGDGGSGGGGPSGGYIVSNGGGSGGGIMIGGLSGYD